MKISIIIPAYEMGGRGVEYLDRLLNSIASQTHKDLEVFVADHSVDDVLVDFVKEWILGEDRPHINIFKNHFGRGNASINMNAAFMLSMGEHSGKVIKIMHQDDWFCNDSALELISNALDREPWKMWGVVGFDHQYEGEVGTKDRCTGIAGCPSSSFFRRCAADCTFDESLILWNDVDLHRRLEAANGERIVIEDLCVTIGIHEHQVTKWQNKSEKEKERWTKEEEYLKLKESMREPYEDRLTWIANNIGSDKGTKIILPGNHGPRLHFTPVYDRLLRRLRDSADTFLLEIGVGSGESMKLWQEYWHKVSIVAIDIDEKSWNNSSRVMTLVADQADRDQLTAALELARARDWGRRMDQVLYSEKSIHITDGYDVIIDDGGHFMRQQQVSFGHLFKHLKPGGFYFIEDLHTSYWERDRTLYGNTIDINEDRSNTTVGFIERYLDTGRFSSEYLTDDECRYLEENVQACKMFDLPETAYGPNKLALFVKK